jgi:hypothetical protein
MNCVTYYHEDSNRIHRTRNTIVPTEDVDDLILEDESDLDSETFRDEEVDNHLRIETDSLSSQKTPFRQAIAAIDLLIHDNKMKYLSFINITVSTCIQFIRCHNNLTLTFWCCFSLACVLLL